MKAKRPLAALTAAVTLALLAIAQTVSAGHHESSAQSANSNTIVDVAVGAGNFTTLVTALKAANLVDTLQGSGPFTVLAPTDAAFAALPEGALNSLLEDPAALKQVLTLHVVAGKAMAADVVGMDSVTTLEGSTLRVSSADGVQIGGANVTATDISASNGVIHVIDTVILPKS